MAVADRGVIARLRLCSARLCAKAKARFVFFNGRDQNYYFYGEIEIAQLYLLFAIRAHLKCYILKTVIFPSSARKNGKRGHMQISLAIVQSITRHGLTQTME